MAWMKVALAAAVCVLGAGSALGQTKYYVRTTGRDTNDGLSKDSAFRTIQKAVTKCTAAGGEYTIYVGPGTYAETVAIGTGAGAAAGSGTAAKLNRIIGDISGVFTGQSPGQVIIDGGSTRDYGLQLDGRNYWRIDQLTFRDQRAYNISWQNSTGGGVYSSVFYVAPSYAVYGYRAADLEIKDNNLIRSTTSGSCIYVTTDTRAGFLTIDANRFSLTGALYLSGQFSTGSLLGFLTNRAATYGILGMVGNGSNTKVDLRITNNVGSDCLLGIYAYANGASSSAVVSNNTMTGCFYPLLVYGNQSNKLYLINNIVTDSVYSYLTYSTNNSGTIRRDSTVKGLLQYNILYPTALTSSTSPATGLITADPKFTNPSKGDFSLRAGSPARDAGYADSAPTTDVRGKTRPADENGDGQVAFDLGAWEGGTRRRLKVLSWWETPHDGASNGATAGRDRTARSSPTGSDLTDPAVRQLLEALGFSSESQ